MRRRVSRCFRCKKPPRIAVYRIGRRVNVVEAVCCDDTVCTFSRTRAGAIDLWNDSQRRRRSEARNG